MHAQLALLLLLAPLAAWADKAAQPPEVIGVWEVVEPNANAEFVTIGPQGAAIHSTQGEPDSNGSWRTNENEVIIFWQNGWTDVITKKEKATIRRRYAPGQERDEEPASTATMKRLKPTPAQHPKAASWGAGVILEHCRIPS